MKILITGGAGFIGSALVRHLINASDHAIVNVDALTYAANLDALVAIEDHPRYVFEAVDIRDELELTRVFATHRPDGIIHLASESHVDRSIAEPEDFLQTNVVGIYRLLKTAARYFRALDPGGQRRFLFHQVSTDEVYGSIEAPGAFAEDARYAPSSPYAATKASADHLVDAWHRTYGLPTVITHSSNNYGPFQQPDKLLPRIISRALAGRPLPVYGDGRQVRDWLYVDDHVRALRLVFEHARIGAHYNIGGGENIENRVLVRAICREIDRQRPDAMLGPRERLVEHVADRAGHDRRYAVDSSKLRADLGWRARNSLENGLPKTVRWYLEHRHWLDQFALG